ncbi:MAG TPA: serine hydrolase domain-containing protein [Atribacterota bacterium]|mgnify:FL=1|nr:serine hydrolase domain-containing protein [Atribacterota bacterium]
MKKTMGILIITGITIGFFVLSYIDLYLADSIVNEDWLLEQFTDHLDCRIQKLMRQFTISGVNIALVRNGQIVYTMAYGYADKESRRKMAVELPVRVQSISKSVTAWAVMKLAEENKINLDEPVSKYLKDWKFPDSTYNTEGITIRRLLSHTAGLPLGNILEFYSPDGPIPSLSDSLSKTAFPFQKPGKGFSYSNVGYNLLELIIEQITGREFAEYMEDEILVPLNMLHSSFKWDIETLAVSPLGYTLKGKAVPHYRYPEKASGGLISTVEDIARFCIAGMNNYSKQNILTPYSVEQLYSPQVNKLGIYNLVFEAYGFGYYLEHRLAVSHGGQGTGWMSHFHSIPGTGDAIIILTNSQRSWPLISSVLKGWARWRGLPVSGMARIILGQCFLWALIGIIVAVITLKAVNTGIYVINNGLRFIPINFKLTNISRIIQLGVSISLCAGLLCCVSRPYLFLTSVFPGVSEWFGRSTAVLAILLFIKSFISK